MTLILSGTDNSVSAPAVQGGTGGTTTGLYYPATNQLALATNGTQALLVDSSQNVGIGTASPGTKLQAVGIIKSGGTGTNGEFNLARTSDGLSVGKISLTESTQILDYNNLLGSGIHTFTVNSVERMRINSSGTVILQGGSTSATGVGITFPATQSASSDANTLDDYEEGTWTPTDQSGASIGLNNQSGYYVKIGKYVYASTRFFFNVNSSSTGAQIGGLPFATNGGGFAVGYTGYTTCGTAVNFRTSGANGFYISNAANGANITCATLSNQEIQMTFLYAAG